MDMVNTRGSSGGFILGMCDLGFYIPAMVAAGRGPCCSRRCPRARPGAQIYIIRLLLGAAIGASIDAGMGKRGFFFIFFFFFILLELYT